ncbi:hypothetical protein [Kribbella shirazensis]|uniref:Uncharacterized protein n=1 Tax=Kribbella shirazensis TaxID=1105143 RepID=A0A7X5V902_9ACTN|nr:hypothetical protein [Kribbella shirazensis]NIK56861.1 hypothetical protein [Kribbella shirazensis]
MTATIGYQLIAGPQFDLDYRRIDAAARRNPSAPEAGVRREVLRSMLDLASGRSDGHHALSYAPGKGDLRDCVTVYIRSDPRRAADYRLVFREIGPAQPGGLPRRELLAIKPRQGANNIYAQVCARLRRHPSDRQPGLNRYDKWSNGHETSRQAELDAKRAIAHAWQGQQPLKTSRPLVVGAPARPPSGERPREAQLSPRGRPSPTGWPERSR